MKRLLILTLLIIGLFSASLTAAAQDPMAPECGPTGCATCESCMHDTALWLGNKCEYAASHCSPCQAVVDFWCLGPGVMPRLKLHL